MLQKILICVTLFCVGAILGGVVLDIVRNNHEEELLSKLEELEEQQQALAVIAAIDQSEESRIRNLEERQKLIIEKLTQSFEQRAELARMIRESVLVEGRLE